MQKGLSLTAGVADGFAVLFYLPHQTVDAIETPDHVVIAGQSNQQLAVLDDRVMVVLHTVEQ